MKTAEEIYKQMDEIMPFCINNGPKPYIIEAMKLYATEKVKEALKLAADIPLKELSCGDNSICGCLGNCERPSIGIDYSKLRTIEAEIVNQINKEE